MPDMTPEQVGWFADIFTRLVTNVGQAVVGKTHVICLAVTGMLSEGRGGLPGHWQDLVGEV
jgi:MoxR-like ATPase